MFCGVSPVRTWVGESGPLMHFPEKIRHFDQRVHVGDLNVQFLGRGGNLAGWWCHDQGSGLEPNALEFVVAGSKGKALEIEVHHLLDFSEPGGTITLHPKTERALLLHGDEGGLWHEMFVNRSDERLPSTQMSAERRRSAHCCKRCNLVEPPVGLCLSEDQFPLGCTEMGDRDARGKHAPPFRVKGSQGCDRGKQGIVPARRVEGKRLQEGSSVFPDIRILLGRQNQGRGIIVLDHGFEAGLHLQQPMPTNLLVQCLECVLIIVVGGLQGRYRLKEQPQRRGCLDPGIHVALFFAVVGLRKEPADQLDEHRHRIIGEPRAKLDDLRDDRRMPSIGIEVAGEPRRRDIALPDHLIPASGRNAGPQARIDGEGAQERDPLGQSNQVQSSRSIRCGTQPMKSGLAYRRIHLQQIIETLTPLRGQVRDQGDFCAPTGYGASRQPDPLDGVHCRQQDPELSECGNDSIRNRNALVGHRGRFNRRQQCRTTILSRCAPHAQVAKQMDDMLPAGLFPPSVEAERIGIHIELLGNIVEHCSRRNFIGHERPAGISHQAKLNRKAELVMLAPPDFNFQPVGWRQGIVTDQAVLIGRNVKKFLSILNLEKLPPGHFLTPYSASRWPCLCPKTVGSVQT
ncbi:hypothetical protein BHMPCIPO_05722 [Ensifer sesbaniae]|nr:hypothetical protein [Ensifer sesbaniae]